MFQVFLGLTPFIGITLIGYLLGYIKIFDFESGGLLSRKKFFSLLRKLLIFIIGSLTNNINETSDKIL